MLRILSEKKLRDFYSKNIGKQYSVLFETENKDGFMYGFTENYLKIKHPYKAELCNTVQPVIVKGFGEDGNLEAVFTEEVVPAL